MISLLPPNATQIEQDIEQVTTHATDKPTIVIDDLWNPDTCPLTLLPWLAWALSVDEWDNEWAEEDKRQTLWDSIYIHRKKGTKSSIRRSLASAGYGEVTIIEGAGNFLYDMTYLYDGSQNYNALSGYVYGYRALLNKPISIQQADQVRTLLDKTAPVRAVLEQLDFTQALNLYNNAINYDGQYTYGVV